MFPLFDRAWMVVLRGWGVFTHASPTQEVPFYMMPSLGGANALRSYSNFRFHDRQLLLAGAESRWPIFDHLDAAVFLDAGTVTARVGDLGLDKTSLRVRLSYPHALGDAGAGRRRVPVTAGT